GSRVEANQVKLVAWPIEAQPEGTARATKDVLGSIARTTIERNQPILQADLVAQGAGLLPLMIPAGMRGMSVRVDNVTGVSGFVTRALFEGDGHPTPGPTKVVRAKGPAPYSVEILLGEKVTRQPLF